MFNLGRSAVAGLLLVSLVVAVPGCGVVSHSQNAAGVRQYQMGQYQLAVQDFEKAIATDPANADGYYNLASTYHKLAQLNNQPQQWKLAQDTYNLCLDRNPNHRDCHRGLAVLLVEQQRSEEAYRLLESWEQRYPSQADPKIELARLSQELGNTAKAREQLNEAIQAEPYNARALTALGQLNEQSGNVAQAIANYERAATSGNAPADLQTRIASLRASLAAANPNPAAPGTRVVTAPSSSAPTATTPPVIR